MKIKPTLPVPKRHRLDAQICMFVLAGLAADNIHSGEWIEHGPEYAEAMEIAATLQDGTGGLKFCKNESFSAHMWHFTRTLARSYSDSRQADGGGDHHC